MTFGGRIRIVREQLWLNRERDDLQRACLRDDPNLQMVVREGLWKAQGSSRAPRIRNSVLSFPVLLQQGSRISTRKEVNTMTYSKPEVVVLGEADRVIQSIKNGAAGDGSLVLNPAYDLDE